MTRLLAFVSARLLSAASRGDVAILFLIVAILSLLVLPLSPVLLDGLIAINLAVSIGLLMLSVYVPTPLGLSTFPTMLLFTTLLRLSLNIASTKQILLNAHAGEIIDAFGHLVVGGNVIVGIVVFLIIAIVQFVVVAKGSERIAEVGARFTLDGMPGKQMSIDADLRVGSITKDEARRRRAGLEEESQFFGAMDGAMKYVKGDAIAAMIIALVNVLAGIALGMFMREMSFAQALQRFTVLSVGDGMVSQIPSLFVSIAAGLLVTRVGTGESRSSNLGTQIGQQVMSQPIALIVTAVILLAFVAAPGVPAWPFGILAVVMGLVGWLLLRTPARRKSFENIPMPSLRRDGDSQTPAFIQQTDDSSPVPLSLRVGVDFPRRVDATDFDLALAQVRQHIKRTLGLPYPGLEVRYDPALEAQAYEIDVYDLPRARAALLGNWYVEGQPETSADNEPSVPEAWGPFRPGRWVEALEPPASPVALVTGEGPGDAVVSSARAPQSVSQVLARHLEWVVFRQPERFIGFQETHQLVEELSKSAPELCQELLRAAPLPRINDVLRRLVQESVSIRPFRDICESLIAWAPREKDAVMLVEYVRIDIGRYIAKVFAQADGSLAAIMVDPAAEQIVRRAIQQSPSGGYLALGPEDSEALTAAVERVVRLPTVQQAGRAVMVASMDVRRYLRRLIETRFPQLPVLSFQEIANHAGLHSVGLVSIEQPRAAQA